MTDTNRRVIVTGASKGIGRAIAQSLAARGDFVLAVARNYPLLAALAKENSNAPGRIEIRAADLRDRSASEAIVTAACEAFGGIDLLINSAGATKRGDFFELGEDDFLDGFALKFHGTVNMVRSAWPHLMHSKGHLINIIGIGGHTPSADFTIGGPVNSALMNFTKAMADRGLKDGVRVNGINPGPIDTDRLQARIKGLAQKLAVPESVAAEKMVAEQRVIGFGETRHVSALVAFLDSTEGAFFHGALIDLDGGATKGM